MKEQIKEALQEGLTGFKEEVKAEVKTTVEEVSKQGLEEVTKRIDAIERLPISRLGVNVNFAPSTYKGYKLEHQLEKARNYAAKNPREFPIFSNDEKANEYAKFMLAFIKAKTRQDMGALADLKEFYQKTNQLQEGTAGEGGYLVPDEYAWEMVKLARNATFALGACSVIPMNSDQMYLPSEATLAAVAWTSEESAATAGEPTFGQVSLTAKRLDGYARVTNELLNDSAIDIVGILTEQFGYAVAEELDNQVLNGTGDPVSGVLTSAAGADVKFASGKTNFSEITADHVSEAVYNLEPGYQAGAQFILNRLGMHYVRVLADSNGNKIFAQPGGSVPGTIWEYPYFVSHKITNTSAAETALACVGNFKYFYIGRRLGVSSLDVDPYTNFTKYATQFRIVTRWGLAVGNANAFARILTATS